MGNKWRRSISRVWSVVWGVSSLFRWFVPLAVRCREHPCLWNFNPTVSIDVIRVYVNCLFDLTCVVMKITINKLNFVPVDWLMSGVVVLLWDGEGIRDISNCRLKFLVLRALSGLFTISCVLFLAFAYFIMYRETLRHQEKIKTKQMPEVEAERFTKENKALETTVFVVGAVIEPCAVAFPISQSNDVSNNT